jgi:hypothetical protein
MSRKLIYEEWNKRTSSGENPHVSKDFFGVAMRDAERQHNQMSMSNREQRAKAQRDAITAAARKKSWEAVQQNKNRKKMFESLNKIFVV